MKTIYHREITEKALGAHFSPEVLKVILRANVGQDDLQYQVGHDHFHYDNNAFTAGDAYVAEQRGMIFAALNRTDVAAAWEAFGRLTHTVQDFYAHSNYVSLWESVYGLGDPQRIEPLDERILQHPDLCSGKLYYPLEALSFIPALEKFVLPHLPLDSHAHMNKDDPNRPFFELAYHAAIKRTYIEYEKLSAKMDQVDLVVFTGELEITL